MPQLDRPPPPYLQIVEHYRGLISSGRLADGDRLPSTRQLAEQWQVAHATAAKVLATLRADGLVTATSGGAGGTLVRRTTPAGVLPGPVVRNERSRGLHPVTPDGAPEAVARVLAADLDPSPPGYVLEALGLPPGTAAIRRRQVVTADDITVSVSTGWFAGGLASTAPALLAATRIAGGTAAYVADRTGRTLASGRDELRIRSADAKVAASLGIAPLSPVLATRSWVFDTLGGVVEFGEAVSSSGLPLAYEYAIA